MNQISTDSSELLLAHLQEEEHALESLLLAVRGVWQALVSRDGTSLTEALQAEAAGLHIGEEMRDKRRRFREFMAERLGTVASDVTLARITQTASPEMQMELNRCRARLTEMSAELAKLNQQNAAMTRQSLDLTRSIISQLTQSGPHFSGYNASGKSDTPHVSPIVQWGG